jgi:hypothetical protein
MYGSVEPLAFTEPDAHGWMAIAPSASPKRWIPRALCFWREVVSMGAVSLEQMTHPARALARAGRGSSGRCWPISHPSLLSPSPHQRVNRSHATDSDKSSDFAQAIL